MLELSEQRGRSRWHACAGLDGALKADNAGFFSTSAEGLAKMMTVVVSVFEAAGLVVSEKKTGTELLRTPDQTTLAPPLAIETAGQIFKQTTQLLYLLIGGIIHEVAQLSLEIDRRILLMRACFKRFGPAFYDATTAPLSLKVLMLEAEVIKTLLYGCVTWAFREEHFAKLRTARHQVLLRIIYFQRRLRTDHTTLSLVREGPQGPSYRGLFLI